MHKKIQHVSKLVLKHFSDSDISNCVKIAVFAQQKFKELYDLDLKIYAGSVAWITHNSELDNIAHGKYLDQIYSPGNWNQHAWNHINGYNIDFTVFQLPTKCARLTAATPEEPCRFKPKSFGDFLIFRKTSTSFKKMPKAGEYLYEKNYILTEDQWKGHI